MSELHFRRLQKDFSLTDDNKAADAQEGSVPQENLTSELQSLRLLFLASQGFGVGTLAQLF